MDVGERGKRKKYTEPVCTVVSPEIFKHRVFDVSCCACTAREGLDHQHLRALMDFNIAHGDV